MRRRLRLDSSGQVIVLAALAQVVLCCGVALAIDVGFLYDVQRREQIAADAGAIAGALVVSTNAAISPADLRAVVLPETALNGFTDGADGVTITVNRPPLAGYYEGDSGYVEVIVRRPTPTYFMRVMGRNSMDVAARGVAGMSSALGCLYALDTLPGQKGLELPDKKTVLAAKCEMYVNSNAFVSNEAALTVHTINISGVREGIGPITGTVNQGTPFVADPLDYKVFPEASFATCGSKLEIKSATDVITPDQCYDEIIVDTTQLVTFPAGSYYAKKGVFFKGTSNVDSTGVTFYVQEDKFEISGAPGTLVKLKAPKTGPSAGMLIFLKKNNNKDILIGNNAEVHLEGTIYTRSGNIIFAGKSTGSLTYSILVANRIRFSDEFTVNLNNDFTELPGGSPVKRPTLGE